MPGLVKNANSNAFLPTTIVMVRLEGARRGTRTRARAGQEQEKPGQYDVDSAKGTRIQDRRHVRTELGWLRNYIVLLRVRGGVRQSGGY